jgi:hypothetical protein
MLRLYVHDNSSSLFCQLPVAKSKQLVAGKKCFDYAFMKNNSSLFCRLPEASSQLQAI